jgi:parvulin-like peptidyl-prolyl isomerase
MKTYNEDPDKDSYPDGFVFTEGEIQEDFECVALSLKVGRVSGVVETSAGYHIIKAYDINEESVPL